MDFIKAIEKALGKKADKQLLPMQEGDMQSTFADITALKNDFNYEPKTAVESGVQEFTNWYKVYYSKK
jgi:UDP-glucuronate 4-epimerase